MTAKSTKKEAEPSETLHIYTRVSSAAQAGNGTSLDTQLEYGIKRSKELNFSYKHWDEGGKSSHHENIEERPVLFDMYQSILAGNIKHLWIYDQSRLSRNDQVASKIRYDCNKHGVTLYTKDGKFDLSNPSDMFLKQIFDAVAGLDNATRAERTRLGKLNKVTSGYWHGGPPPFGYKLESKKLVIEKTEAKWVSKIFDGILKEVSVAELKKMLDSKGVVPRRKGLWAIGSIESLIKNTHYIGYYFFEDKKCEKKIHVKCPAILDEITWKAVQLARSRKVSRTQQKNPTKNFYLLRDLMFCSHCGRPMAGRIKPAKHEALYYCPNKERQWVVEGGTNEPWVRGLSCGMARSLNIPETDRMVWDSVIKIHKESTLLREPYREQIYKNYGLVQIKSESELKDLANKIKKLKKELSAVEETQGVMEADYLLGDIKKQVYAASLGRLKEKIDALEIQISNAELEYRGNNENKRFVDWVKMFSDDIGAKQNLTNEEKKKYLSGLIKKINVRYLAETNEHELTIQFYLPIVGDALKWSNPNMKKAGYELVEGVYESNTIIKKKDRVRK